MKSGSAICTGAAGRSRAVSTSTPSPGCAMRQVLVDYARRRLAAKRAALSAAGNLDEFAASDVADARSAAEVVEIGLLMDKLGQVQPKTRLVVDLHYFVGFSFEEIAGSWDSARGRSATCGIRAGTG
jgi:ECF sigma factor